MRLSQSFVPTLKEIGLWGKRIQRAFADMGVLEFAALDPEEGMRADESEADEHYINFWQWGHRFSLPVQSCPGTQPGP